LKEDNLMKETINKGMNKDQSKYEKTKQEI